jgi:SAM-dependent methyltransferase
VTAAEHWRRQLADWAIPDALLAAVEDSPYRWPVELFRRRNISAEETGPSPTVELADRLAGPGGSVLDIGAGTGRVSIPLARSGHPVTALERSPEMVAALRQEAADVDGYRIVEGTWPEHHDLGVFDVTLAAHVVYDVAELGPFLRTMTEHARRAVVLEMTDTHPWTPLGPYYLALHGLDRPTGPTVEDLVAVVSEECGVRPEVEWWERPGGTWFESWEEIEELYRRRLVLPPARAEELRPLLEPDVRDIGDGRLVVGEPVRCLATVWWPVGD